MKAKRRPSSAGSHLPPHAGDVLWVVWPAIRMDEDEPVVLPCLTYKEPLLLLAALMLAQRLGDIRVNRDRRCRPNRLGVIDNHPIVHSRPLIAHSDVELPRFDGHLMMGR
jgi:hypothetical protein